MRSSATASCPTGTSAFLLIRSRPVPLPPAAAPPGPDLPAALLAHPGSYCGTMHAKLPAVFCWAAQPLVPGWERPAV